MYEEHPVFEKPHNENTKIWRYMDFTKFVSLLEKRALFFTRVDKLGDPFEGSYPLANIEAESLKMLVEDFFQHHDVNDDVKASMINSMLEAEKNPNRKIAEVSRKFLIANCWHINEYESAAMWKLYLKSNEGIAIQSTFKKLTRSFDNNFDDCVYIGKIKYIDYQTEHLPIGNNFHPSMHKRKSFEYECELRALIWPLPPTELGENPVMKMFEGELFSTGKYIPVDLNVLVERVFVSPSSPSWFKELVESVMSKYYFSKEVVRSNLADRPMF